MDILDEIQTRIEEAEHCFNNAQDELEEQFYKGRLNALNELFVLFIGN